MASAIVAIPGTKFGPCDHPCDHLDCKEMQTTARSTCFICGERIGYETRYHASRMDEPGFWVHSICDEHRIESQVTATGHDRKCFE